MYSLIRSIIGNTYRVSTGETCEEMSIQDRRQWVIECLMDRDSMLSLRDDMIHDNSLEEDDPSDYMKDHVDHYRRAIADVDNHYLNPIVTRHIYPPIPSALLWVGSSLTD